MRHSIKAFVYKGENYYIAECMEIAVVTQSKTLDETITNLQEAFALHLEGENLADFDLPQVVVSLSKLELSAQELDVLSQEPVVGIRERYADGMEHMFYNVTKT